MPHTLSRSDARVCRSNSDLHHLPAERQAKATIGASKPHDRQRGAYCRPALVDGGNLDFPSAWTYPSDYRAHVPSPLVTGYFDANAHQGRHGEAFVHALTAAAGLNIGSYESDVGIDWIISAPGPRGTNRSPKIEVQVKSWSTPAAQGATWAYPLKTPTYNHLAGPGHFLPHYLFLCLVPDDATQYSSSDPDQMVVRQAAYWLSLADQSPDANLNPDSTKTVYVPTANLLTAATLVALVEGRLSEATV